MKKIIALLAVFVSIPSYSDTVSNERVQNSYPDVRSMTVIRKPLGAGSPAPMITVGNEQAIKVDDNYFHIPQNMPFYPTAGVIWPRVVELECEKIEGNMVCEGYNWHPRLGRGEYLFVVPKLKPSLPVKETIIRESPPVIIYKEVPVKRKRG